MQFTGDDNMRLLNLEQKIISIANIIYGKIFNLIITLELFIHIHIADANSTTNKSLQ